jgi:hypothetical protein
MLSVSHTPVKQIIYSLCCGITIHEIPVLARAGAIIPMTGEQEARQNGVATPSQMEIRVFGGADGSFELYEDDGESNGFLDGEFAITAFDFLWRQGNETLFCISPGVGQVNVLSEGIARLRS